MLQKEIQRISSLIAERFDAASDLPPDQRAAFLDGCCNASDPSDTAIRAEVERLLRYLDQTGTLDEALWAPPPSPSSTALQPGELVAGRFRIRRMIGSGGMGEVYEAEDIVVGQTVALKTIRADMASDAGQAERFRRELLISRNISHRNVCKVYEYGAIEDPNGGLRFFTMELLRGETLAQRIASLGRLSAKQALPILEQVAAGLEEVHRSGIIHRDLKPSNIFLVREPDGDERAVVMDFGLARDLTDADLRQTRTGLVMGTLLYMPPELGKSVGVFTDIYSFGIVALEMMTGSPAPVVAPRNVVPTLDPAWDQAVLACVSPEPEKRPTSALQVVAIMQRHTRRWRRLAIVCGAVLCVGAGVSFWRWMDPGTSVGPVATQVTYDSGFTTDPAADANGKVIVYSSDRGSERGDLNVWLQHLDTGETRQLTDDPGDEDEPAISPDGKLFAYTGEGENVLHLKSVSGSSVNQIVAGGNNAQFSPDGRLLAYWKGQPADLSLSGQIWIMPVNGGAPRQIASGFADARLPTWSPDGRLILFRGTKTASPSTSANADLSVADINGGDPKPTGASSKLKSLGLALHPSPFLWDGPRIIFAGQSSYGVNLWTLGLNSLMRKSYGTPHALTSGAGVQQVPTPLTDGKVAYASWSEQIHLWKVDCAKGGIEQITTSDSLDTRVSVARDGRTLVFGRRLGGNRDIWTKDLTSGIERQLTSNNSSIPFVSPSGRIIAFSTGAAIRLLDIQAGTQKLLCESCGELLGWFPSEAAVLYRTGSSTGVQRVQALDLTTGKSSVLLTGNGLHELSVSPNGVNIAFTVRGSNLDSRIFLARVNPFEPAKAWLPLTQVGEWSDKPIWSDDGGAVYYHSKRDNFECLWGQKVEPESLLAIGPSRAVHHFHGATLTLSHLGGSGFSMAQAKGSLFVSVGSYSGNIWTIRTN